MNPNGDFYSEIAQDSIQLDCRLIRFPLSFAPSKTETMTDCSQPYYTLFGGHSATLFRATSPSRDSRRHSLPSAMHLVSTTTLHSPLSTLHSSHTFSAKERDAETGLSYFGARYYSSDLSIWLSVNPQAAKYPSLSPYVYCADNPIKLVDPNGEEFDTPLIILGPHSKEAVEALDAASSLDISIDKKGIVTATGKAETKNDKVLMRVIKSKSITTLLITTECQKYNSKDGGKNIWLNPAAFEGSEKNVALPMYISPRKLVAKQIININAAKVVSSVIGESLGETISHEVKEAFWGAKIEPGGSYENAYERAHKHSSNSDRVRQPNVIFRINDEMIEIQNKSEGKWIKVY